MSFLPSVVPRIQQKVVSLPIVESNPRLKSLLEHPAGPFTSAFARPSPLPPPAHQPPPRPSPTLTLSAAPLDPTVHFWAPSFKWFITFANIADLSRPVEKVSVPQQSGTCLDLCVAPSSAWIGAPHRPFLRSCSLPCDRSSAAVALTGVIWSRYSTQITPVNYNLLSVNLFMAVTGLYQLYRVATHKPAAEPVSAVAAAAPATPAAVEDGARSK